MVRTNMLSPRAKPRPTIYVEPYDEGRGPRTLVKVEFVHRGGLSREEHVFPSLGEALAYAQQLSESNP
ncbi:MAG TPA: hypothetical protein VLK65_09200 [Vicinamibacteria bacterium]|nr:hypothetical protein [Vicinamibacteria bacterium]